MGVERESHPINNSSESKLNQSNPKLGGFVCVVCMYREAKTSGTSFVGIDISRALQ